MNELLCKGTPAQVAFQVFQFLVVHHADLEWVAEGASNQSREEFDDPDELVRALGNSNPRLDPHEYHILIQGYSPSDKPGEQFRLIGEITADARSGETLLRAVGPRFGPIWTTVKAELERGRLVVKMAQDGPERTEDAPKIGAPRLADLPDDDPRAIERQNLLRDYLLYILRERNPKTQTAAADLVGKSRGALQRYRERWPAIETEVKAEIATQRAQKVRKV